MSAEPQFADTSDPRVYGYDYETGLTPNFAFDGQWAGAEAIPSSDNGEVVRMSEIHQMQQRQAQAQQQSATIAAMEQQQRAYQQSLQAQPIYEAAPAHNFYVPVPTRPLYPEQGASPQPMVQPPTSAGFSGVHPHAHRHHQQRDLSGLMLRPQPPAVPAPHSVPPYPWAGHGQPGSFDGPSGTSPMSRGGPNVGAFAAAPAVPRDYTGGSYPLAAPGTYVPRDGLPPFAGYAGLDLSGLDEALGAYGNEESWRDRRKAKAESRRAAREERKLEKLEEGLINYESPKRGQYRDVTGQGGYKYRQFQDGIIRIMEGSPDRQGQLLSSSDASTQKAWTAVTNEIGTWDQYAAQRRDSRLEAAGSILESAGRAVSTVAGGKKKKGRRKKGRRAGAAVDSGLPAEYPETEESGLPSWVLPVGIGVAVLAVIAVVASGNKKK